MMAAPLLFGIVHSRMMVVCPPDLAVRTGISGAAVVTVVRYRRRPRTRALTVACADYVVVDGAMRKACVLVGRVGGRGGGLVETHWEPSQTRIS